MEPQEEILMVFDHEVDEDTSFLDEEMEWDRLRRAAEERLEWDELISRSKRQ